MVSYYLTKEVRIVSDGNNFVPEVYAKKKKKDYIEGEDEYYFTWTRLGYYSSFENALRGLIRDYTNATLDNSPKTVTTFKQALKLLNDLKNNIVLKVVQEKDEILKENEGENNGTKRKRRTNKSNN